ncbi:MAG: DMT family transporter [Candidatus Heimdallarchaeota archaeon]|nr:DMT family transporter [Candidatus Heimdallarchaeota archaeon]MCK5049194.1 DMT family transporter [Candidatus Heimdallarchaeota archaeon]
MTKGLTKNIESETVKGALAVSGANALRALDAPVRNPIIAEWDPVNFKVKINTYRSTFIVMMEHMIGSLIMILVMTFKFKSWGKFVSKLKTFTKQEWFSALFIGIGSSALGLWFFTLAYGHNPSTAVVTQKVQPLISIFVAMIILKERSSKNFYIGSAVAFVGVVLVAISDWDANFFESGAFMGTVYSLLAAILWGSGTVFGRILTKKMNHWEITTLRYMIGTYFLMIMFTVISMVDNTNYLSVLTDKFQVWGIYELFWIGWFCILYMTVVTGLIPLVIYYTGLKRINASFAGILELSFPILGLFIGIYILDYGFVWTQFLGAALVLGSVTIVAYLQNKDLEQNIELEASK